MVHRVHASVQTGAHTGSEGVLERPQAPADLGGPHLSLHPCRQEDKHKRSLSGGKWGRAAVVPAELGALA